MLRLHRLSETDFEIFRMLSHEDGQDFLFNAASETTRFLFVVRSAVSPLRDGGFVDSIKKHIARREHLLHWQTAVESIRVTHLPYDALLVYCRPATAHSLWQRPDVGLVRVLHPSLKGVPAASTSETENMASPRRILVLASHFEETSTEEFARDVLGLGGTVAGSNEMRGHVFLHGAPGSSVAADRVLLNNPRVVAVLESPVAKTLNYAGASILVTGAPDGSHGLVTPDSVFLTGAGETINVADSGLDYSSCFFYDASGATPYITRNSVALTTQQKSQHVKISGYWSFIDSVWASSADHGTHVSGIAAGANPANVSSVGLVQNIGNAPGAKILLTDLGCQSSAGCTCGGTATGVTIPCGCSASGCSASADQIYAPNDIQTYLFPWAKTNGAYIHTNSWGSTSSSSSYLYQSTAAAIDSYLYSNRDMTLLFAAGNSGTSSSLTDEAQAKNAIVVGASRVGLQRFVDVASSITNWQATSVEYGQAMAQTLGCTTGSLLAICQYFSSPTFDACATTSYCGYGSSISNACGCVASSTGTVFYLLGSAGCKVCALPGIEAQDPAIASWETLASFSSMGPTADGRIKPDVVAPGDIIGSAGSVDPSTIASNKCGAGSRSDYSNLPAQMMTLSGTSMATPGVAGVVAQIRQYLRNYYPNPVGITVGATPFATPPASLVKAIVVNAARTMVGLYSTTSSFSSSSTIKYLPSNNPYYQGFGRVALENSVPFNSTFGYTLKVLEAEGETFTAAGDVATYSLLIPNVTTQTLSELRVTLVWTDYPSTAGTVGGLVSDLDLTLTTSSGGSRFGNDQFFTSADHSNNVERIIAQNPVAGGTYSIAVKAYSLPMGSQTYSLVASYGVNDYVAPTINYSPQGSSAFQPRGGLLSLAVASAAVGLMVAVLLL